MVATALVLLGCLSSVVRSDGPSDESSVAAVVKAMVEEQVATQNKEIANQKGTIAALTAALEAKQMDHKHVQLTTGGEVVELVSAAHVKALEKQIEACARRGDAQDAEIGSAVAAVRKMREELNEGCVSCGERGHQLIRESGVTQAKLVAQEAQINGLSATVAQFLATSGARPMHFDAGTTAATSRGRPMNTPVEAVTTPPSQEAVSPRRRLETDEPQLPATANELRISGRHTAIAFNTNIDGVEAFRCVGVGDEKLTCSGELRAADFRTADGISLAELARFTGMVPPSAPPPSPPPTPPPDFLRKPFAVGSVTDGANGFDEFGNPIGVATFVIGTSTYAIAAGYTGDGVQLIDVSDPSSPAAVGSATDGVNGFDELDGARARGRHFCHRFEHVRHRGELP